MKNKKTVILILVIILLISTGMIMLKSNHKDTDIYYRSAFSIASSIYSEMSGMLMIDNSTDLIEVQNSIKNLSDEAKKLKTNIETKDGENVLNEMFRLSNIALELKKEKISEKNYTNNDGIFEIITSIENELRKFEINGTTESYKIRVNSLKK